MSMDKYRILEIIGEGTYGKVFKAQEKESGRVVAIKKFKQREDEDPHVRKTMLREIKVLKEFRHDNIVNLRSVFREKGKLYLIFDFVQNTLLQELIASPSGLPAEKMKMITYQILRANQFLHENKIMHRDIKPENLLLSKQGVVKLCDFGFARQMHKSSTFAYTDYVSTRWYRSPELLVGDANYTGSVDVWAIGCIFAEIFNGMPLFPGDSDLHTLQLILETITADDMDQGKEKTQELSKKQRVAFRLNPLFEDMKVPSAANLVEAPDTAKEVSLKALLKDVGETQLDFIRKCLLIDGQERSNIASLLEHPLFDEEFKANFEESFKEMQQKDEDEMVSLAAQKLTTKDGQDELDPEALVTEDEKEEGSSADEFEDDNEDSSSAIGQYEDGEESLMGRSRSHRGQNRDHYQDDSSTPVSSSGVSPAPYPQKTPRKCRNQPDLLQHDENSKDIQSLQVSTMNRNHLKEKSSQSGSACRHSKDSVGPHSRNDDPNQQTLLVDLIKNSTFDLSKAEQETDQEPEGVNQEEKALDDMGNGLVQGKAFLLKNKKTESPLLQNQASSNDNEEQMNQVDGNAQQITSQQVKQQNLSEKSVSSLKKSRDKLLQQIPQENSSTQFKKESENSGEISNQLQKQQIDQQKMANAMSTAQKRVSLNSYMVESSITEQIKEENSNPSDKSNKGESTDKKPLNVEIKDDINIFSGQGQKSSNSKIDESSNSNNVSESKNDPQLSANNQKQGSNFESQNATNFQKEKESLQEYQQKLHLQGQNSQNQPQISSYDDQRNQGQDLSRQSRESQQVLPDQSRQKNKVQLHGKDLNLAMSKMSSGTLPRDTEENTPQVQWINQQQQQQDRAKRSLTQGHAQTFTNQAQKGSIVTNGGRISRVNITFSQSPESSPNPRQITIVSQQGQLPQNQNAINSISTQEARDDSSSLYQQRQQMQDFGSKNSTQRSKNYIISHNESVQKGGNKIDFTKAKVTSNAQQYPQSQLSKQLINQPQNALKSARDNANTPSTTNQSLISPQVKLLSQETAFGVEGSGFSKLINMNGLSGPQTQINSLQFEGENVKEISAFTGKPIYQMVTKQYPQTQVKGLSSKQQAILKQTSSLEKLTRERQGLHQNGTSPQHLPNLKMMNSGLTSQKKANNFRDISEGKLTLGSLNNNGKGSMRTDQKLKSLNNGHVLSNTNVLAVSNQPPLPQTSHATGKMNHTYQNYHNARGTQNTHTDFKIGAAKHSQSNSVTHPKNIDKHVHQPLHFKESSALGMHRDFPHQNHNQILANSNFGSKYGNTSGVGDSNQNQYQPIKLMLFPKLNEQSDESMSPAPAANAFNSVGVSGMKIGTGAAGKGGPMIRTTQETQSSHFKGVQNSKANHHLDSQYVHDMSHQGRITTLSQKGKSDHHAQQFMLPKRYSEMGNGLVQRTPQKFMNFHQKIAHQNYLQQESDHMRKHAYLGSQSKRVAGYDEKNVPKTEQKKSGNQKVADRSQIKDKVTSLETGTQQIITSKQQANEYMLGSAAAVDQSNNLRQGGGVSQLSFNLNPSDALSYNNTHTKADKFKDLQSKVKAVADFNQPASCNPPPIGDKSSKVSLHSSNFFENGKGGLSGKANEEQLRNSSTRKMHNPMQSNPVSKQSTTVSKEQRISGLGSFSKQKGANNTRISHQNNPSFTQTMQQEGKSGSQSPPKQFANNKSSLNQSSNLKMQNLSGQHFSKQSQNGKASVSYGSKTFVQGQGTTTTGSMNGAKSGVDNRRSQYTNYSQFGGGKVQQSTHPQTIPNNQDVGGGYQSPDTFQRKDNNSKQVQQPLQQTSTYSNQTVQQQQQMQMNLHGSSSSVQMSPMTSLFTKGKFFQGQNGSQPLGLSHTKMQQQPAQNNLRGAKNDTNQLNTPLKNQMISKLPLGQNQGASQFQVSNVADSRQFAHNQPQVQAASQIVTHSTPGESQVQYGHATSTSWTTTSIQNGQNKNVSPQTANQIQNYFNEKNSFPRRNITNKLKNAQNVAARRANLREMTNTQTTVPETQARPPNPQNNINLPSQSRSPKSSIALGGGILVHTNQKGQYEIGIERTPLSNKMMLPVLTANPSKSGYQGTQNPSDPKVRSYLNSQKQQALMQASLTQLRGGVVPSNASITNGMQPATSQMNGSNPLQHQAGGYSESLNRQSTMSQSPKAIRSSGNGTGPAPTSTQMEINNAILMAAASHNVVQAAQMTSSEFNFKGGKSSQNNQMINGGAAVVRSDTSNTHKIEQFGQQIASVPNQSSKQTGSYGYHRIVRKVPTQLIPKSNKRAKELAGLYL